MCLLFGPHFGLYFVFGMLVNVVFDNKVKIVVSLLVLRDTPLTLLSKCNTVLDAFDPRSALINTAYSSITVKNLLIILIKVFFFFFFSLNAVSL